MSKKKGQQIVFPLGSEEEFFAAIEASSKYLTVVDIHQGWCGPCSIMEPIYRKAYIELDRAEERLKFYTIEAEKLTEKGRAGLPVTEACKPLFVVYKNGKAISKVQGAQAPELETAVFDNVPDAPRDNEE